MKTAVPGTRIGGVGVTAAMKSSSGTARAVIRSAMIRRPVFHVVISVKMNVPTMSGNQPPWTIFSRLAPKKARSIDEKHSRHGRRGPERPLPPFGRDHVQQHRRDDHRHRDGDAVGRGQRARRFEADDDQDRADGEGGVDLRDVDLSHLVRRGVLDVETRRISELDRLPGQREGAGDQCL